MERPNGKKGICAGNFLPRLFDVTSAFAVSTPVEKKWNSCKILASILQECHCIQDFCKNDIASNNLPRIDSFVRILQDFLNLQETCKILQEIKFLSTTIAVVYVWADLTGGLKTLCIKIGYSEPSRAESREGSSTVAERSRVP